MRYSDIYIIITCPYCKNEHKWNLEELSSFSGALCSCCRQKLNFKIKNMLWSLPHNSLVECK